VDPDKNSYLFLGKTMESDSKKVPGIVPAMEFDEVWSSDAARKIIESVLDGFTDDPHEKESLLETTREIMKGKTFGQGAAINEEHLDMIAHLAAQQFMAAHYNDALRLYGFITIMNHYDARSLKGMAMCHQKMGNHQEALRCFGLALVLKPDDIDSILMTADSLLRTGHLREALDIVDKVFATPLPEKSPSEIRDLHQKAAGLREVLILQLTHSTKSRLPIH
jgi:secretion system chaperone SscA